MNIISWILFLITVGPVIANYLIMNRIIQYLPRAIFNKYFTGYFAQYQFFVLKKNIKDDYLLRLAKCYLNSSIIGIISVVCNILVIIIF